MGNFSNSLESFWVRGCNITGVIPSEIGNLTGSLVIYLSENQLTGSIPTSVGRLKQLQILSLRGNRLQGHIPRDLCQMSSLGDLHLMKNMLTGPIPECLGELKSLRIVSLGSNKLNSTIPSNLWNLRDLVGLSLSSNNLVGNLSSGIGSLKSLSQLDLSSNQLSGDIPSLIDGFQSLEILNLSSNKFEGSIPRTLENIKGLIVLDLSSNSLSGSIPKSLEDLLFLRILNVSYNSLEGRIPDGRSFVNFTAESFVRNSAPPCVENDRRSRRNNVGNLVKYIMPPIFISAIVLEIVVVMLMRRKRLKQIPSTDDTLVGSVWRNRELEGAVKSFETEGEILSSIRHRNLVRIIGCCSSPEFKALILGYMPNGSLDRWLYLTQRLQIAVALEYLHHGHTFPVVHCDIKPSNVLLDGDISDFGMAKLFGEGEAVIQTKTLATVGYAAPEYGSEGIVSTDDMLSGEMNLKEWVSRAVQGLLSGEDRHFSAKEQCVSSIF